MTESKGKIVTIRLPEEFHRALRVKIAGRGTSFQFVVTKLLEEWLAEAEVQESGKRPLRKLGS